MDWAVCAVCGLRTTPERGWVCDWVPCLRVVCERCHPGGQAVTWWCERHRPQRVTLVAPLAWRMRESLMHPGREEQPSAREEQGWLRAGQVPREVAQVQARAVTEGHRRKVVARAVDFAKWYGSLRGEVRRRWGKDGAMVVAEYVHGKVLTGVELEGRRRVGAPTTPEQWVRLLSAAFVESAPIRSDGRLGRLLEGYHALAPGPRQQERDKRAEWLEARAEAAAGLEEAEDEEERQLWAAVWLMLTVQLLGARPREALGCTMASARWEQVKVATVEQKESPVKRRRARGPQGDRSVVSKGSPGVQQQWRVGVLITKVNPTGKTQSRVWWRLPVGQRASEVHDNWPLPYERAKEACDIRKEILRKHGIDTTYSARRDALTMAEAEGVDPGKVAAHRPGSRRTAEYTNNLIPTSVQAAMAKTLME